MSDSLQPHVLETTLLLCPGKNTEVGCHALLQVISPWTQVSCIAGRFFAVWAIQKAPKTQGTYPNIIFLFLNCKDTEY